MRREEAGGLGLGDEIGVEAEHDVGLGGSTFELETGQKLDAIGNADIGDLAFAGLFEGFGDLGARAPFGDEAFIGVDGQRLVGGNGIGREDEAGRRGKR
ncbi:hypothetical protein D3C72_2159780 [compost metagenome]